MDEISYLGGIEVEHLPLLTTLHLESACRIGRQIATVDGELQDRGQDLSGLTGA